ncbi:MAG: helix-turn-helix domain-containing protein [Acidobacteriota bacterium]|nr:helix-turn-helix domain-containing protein [Acidobacteriota bacterium]
MGNRRKAAIDVQGINRALGDPRRFEILQQIARGCSVACSELREQTPITPATLSHHLKELEAVGLVSLARNGKFVDVTFRREIWQRYLEALQSL